MSSQLNHRNCSYELLHLITGNHRSKATEKVVLKHTILYIHCVDLLMWSLTKLDFPFYDFSIIYYDFSKIHPK